MSTTTETIGRLLVLFGALALGGCDGGIFGTGDGTSDVDLPVASAPSSMEGTFGPGSVDGGGATGGLDTDDVGADADAAPGAGVTDGNLAEGDTGGEASPAVDGPTVPGAPLENRVPEPPAPGAASGPRARLVNASASPLALSVEPGAGSPDDVPDIAVGPGEASAYVTLPDAVEGLAMRRGDGEPGGAVGGVPLYRFSPLDLAPTSVTTMFARTPPGDEAGGGALEVMALATRTASDDPTQALVRLVDATAGSDPEAAPTRRTLLSSAPEASGVDVELSSVPFGAAPAPDATTAPGYALAPAGDYRLAGADGVAADVTLSIEAGRAVTLVLIGDGASVLLVDDGGR